MTSGRLAIVVPAPATGVCYWAPCMEPLEEMRTPGAEVHGHSAQGGSAVSVADHHGRMETMFRDWSPPDNGAPHVAYLGHEAAVNRPGSNPGRFEAGHRTAAGGALSPRGWSYALLRTLTNTA
jgi:hypothetical protein